VRQDLFTAKGTKKQEGKTPIREYCEQARIKPSLSLTFIRAIRG